MRTIGKAIVLIVGLMPALAAAEPQAEVSSGQHHSVNVSPLGLLIGGYNVNYEYLSGSHGLLAEASLSRSSSENAHDTSLGGSVGYRWHWSGGQDSGFLGIQAGVYRGNSHGETRENGMVVHEADFDTRSLYVVGNVGRRWAWESGFNITLRVGGGWADYEVSTDSENADDQMIAQTVHDLLERFPIAIDGELSLGFAF